jgi:hypothetical protein
MQGRRVHSFVLDGKVIAASNDRMVKGEVLARPRAELQRYNLQ